MAEISGHVIGGWDWPEWGKESESASRRERVGRLLGPGVFLVFLIQPIADVLNSSGSAALKAGVVSIVVGYGLSYVAVASRGNRFSHSARVLAVAWLALFPIALAILLGPGSLVFFTYAVSPALMMLPRNIGFLFGMSTALGLLVSSKVVNGSIDWGDAMTLVVLTAAMFAFGALLNIIGELRRTQDKMAKLAVAEERSRLARDLHDVLGHSLTTITVKAGLARRVLETDADRERAIAEVRDVEDLARQAMAEVRSTVSGYRTASLPAELVGARAALQAAGIEADLPRAVDNVAANLQETFAYVLREGVTNIIRHSEATRCEVRLGDSWLEVRDNGRLCLEKMTTSRDSGGGHGLAGLAERVAAVGGELAAKPLPTGGFVLRAQVVAQPPEASNGIETQQSGTAFAGQRSVGLA
ncbi:MAG TPA: histidine kinase [Pseudonocardiaceae bacterium]|jgi:two-component system sensor histidine kinase DesK|nr:histidine kinase [Pseudonocardiaceae bacterium]